jgi:hypothetical protein
MGMEIIQLSGRIFVGLATAADTLDQGGEIGLYADKKLGDFVQAVFDYAQPRGMALAASSHWLACVRQPVAPKNFVQVLGFPAESHGQRFQSSRAAAALHSVALDFANNRRRHMRALREFTLTPSEFRNSLIDGLSDRRPILRHTFLRAPPSAQRLADPRQSVARHRASPGMK